MKLLDEHIVYRRVKWKPDDGDWWVKVGELYLPQPVSVALGNTKERKRRLDQNGQPVPGKAGMRERGLSVNAHEFPSRQAVEFAARQDLVGYRVIGFVVGEVRALGFEVEYDPTDKNHEAYEATDGENLYHSLIITAASCKEDACNLLRPLARQRLIGASYLVDVSNGELARKYYPHGYSI